MERVTKRVKAETHMFAAQKQTLQTIYIKICGEICEQLFQYINCE